MFGMMIDIGPKCYTVPSPPLYMNDLKVKVMYLEFLKWISKVFTMSVFCIAFDGFDLYFMMIDTDRKLYVVASPSQYMTLRSRSQT